MTCLLIIIGSVRRDLFQYHSYNDSAFLLPQNTLYPLSQNDKEIVDTLIHTKILKDESLFKIISNPELSVHASAIMEKDSTLMALFYAGTKEGAADVKIYQSFLYKDSKEWSKSKPILTRQDLEYLTGKYFRKLGNPIVFKDNQGKVHCFVVGVSLGGWATSKIYQFYFDSMWALHYVGELHLSPFGNLSHLVRTPAIPLQNGGFIVPIAHEMWIKYPLIVFFDKNGVMRFKKRINKLTQQLQPTIMPIANRDCVAFFRSQNISDVPPGFYQECHENANVWDTPILSNLSNHDSSSVLISFDNYGKQEILLAHNNKTRKNLTLYWLQDHKQGVFKELFKIDEQNGEVSYPAMAIDNENLYITWTFYRKNIKYTSIKLSILGTLIENAKNEILDNEQNLNMKSQVLSSQEAGYL